TFGLETVSLRYFNVFGPRQDPESRYAAVIPKFIISVFKGEPLEVHGDGKQTRDFSYVDNVVRANILAAKAGDPEKISGEVFNVACGSNYSIMDIAEAIAKVTGKKPEYKFTPSRKGDVRHTLADISKAKRHLGYDVSVDFSEGMKRTIEYFRKVSSAI
ncbi:MAG: GDP-mannose 4,6-dehydratase, partial [Elusimicrobia bacterium]|nr:GDP-mannose 4,6-dehydratase [Elusimicrobiota bacterium]